MTALEWFIDQMQCEDEWRDTFDYWESLKEKALEMEKQQKIDFAIGYENSMFRDAEMYHDYLESKQTP